MGNSQYDVPSSLEKEWLLNNYENQCIKAANAILNADCLIVCIGAGFSADSGLPVYKDIDNIPIYKELNIKYSDISNPQWIKDDPELFYGWLGKCFNDYRNSIPHNGYNIIKKWRDSFFSINNNCNKTFPQIFSDNILKYSQDDITKPTCNPFYIYSSNVDGHLLKMDFKANEIYEIHGSIEKWQCSDRECIPCISNISDTWDIPKDYKFQVDINTMRAKNIPNKETNNKNNINKAFSSNHPICPHCNKLARPNILMFNDLNFVRDTNNFNEYYKWRKILCNLQKTNNIKLVILEIGCGNNVPTVRCESQSIFKTSIHKLTTFIRINPDYPMVNNINIEDEENIISIMNTGLQTLELIDKHITLKMKN